MLAILFAMSCGAPASPTTATATSAKPEHPATNRPTIEQCEQVLSRMADVKIAQVPVEDADVVAAKKKFVVERSRKEGVIDLCMQGTRAMAECLIRASDAESQKRCALLP